MRILLVEDHPALGNDLKKGLERCHYAVDLVADGADALIFGETTPYDLVILDVLLPGLDGWEVCRRLRVAKRTMPILFLTARGEVEDRIRGLDLGGDDYLTKPFDFRELEARVRALLRREGSSKCAALHVLDITLDTRTQQASRGGRQISLSSKEYALLHFLMSRPGEVLSRTTIAEHVWDYDAEHLSNVIDVYIGYLRKKLCAAGEPDVLHAKRGAGYQLREPEA